MFDGNLKGGEALICVSKKEGEHCKSYSINVSKRKGGRKDPAQEKRVKKEEESEKDNGKSPLVKRNPLRSYLPY